MLPFAPEPSVFQTAKCYFSYGTMGHVHADQPPAIERTAAPDGTQIKLKKPWASFQALDFVSQLDLVLPQDCAEMVRQKLVEGRSAPQFLRVVMPLEEILRGDFFKEYIKAGNILMLSEGHAGKDNVFTLQDGKLTMFLDRETYERAGLVGQTVGAKGGRGLRPRWVVEFDLNAPSMWPGKKGYDRLLYAAKNVLNGPTTWLFCNLFDAPNPDPLGPFSPVVCTVSPTVTDRINATLPPLGRPASLLHSDGGSGGGNNSSSREAAEDDVVELYEWLSLVRLGSPRVEAGDAMDPYLSRYQVPGTLEEAAAAPGQLCTIRWRGFLSPSWTCQTLLDVILALPSSKTWFSLTASAFSHAPGLAGDGAECTFFRPSKAPGEYLLWDVRGNE